MRFIVTFFLITITLLANDLADFKTLSGNFTQKVTNSNNNTIEYKGELFLKQNNILWKYKTPIEKNVFIKDSFVIVDEPEIEQAVFTSVSNELNLINMLKKAKKINDSLYEVKYNHTVYSIILNDKKLSKIEYKDEMDNRISVEFKDIKKDIEINDSIFAFTPPSHYDIVRK